MPLRLVRRSVLLGLAGLVLSVSPGRPVLAQEDSPPPVVSTPVADAETFVVVDPTSASLDVSHHYVFTNPNVERTFTGFLETVPADAHDVIAVIGDQRLAVIQGAIAGPTTEILVVFPAELEPGDSIEVELSWRRDELSGSPAELDLVGDALIAIDVFAVGHGGVSTLTLQTPADYDVAVASNLTVTEPDSTEDGEPLLLHTDEAEPYLSLPIVLEAPDRLHRAPVPGIAVDIVTATLDANDGELSDAIRAVVSQLDGWLPLPPPGAMEFRHGWTDGAELLRVEAAGGAASRDVSHFVVPVDFERAVIAREIAAAWLAAIDFDDPELMAAFASALGDDASVRTGGTVSSARLGPIGGPGVNPWIAPVSSSLATMDDTETAAVFESLSSGEIVYAGAEPLAHEGAVDWRVVLDTFEIVGGNRTTPDHFEAALGDLDALEARRDARQVYSDLTVLADEWALPPFLRRAMAEWAFDTVGEWQEPTTAVLGLRDDLRLEASELELHLGTAAADAFESATDDLDSVEAVLAEQADTLVVMAEARQLVRGERGLLARVGLAGIDTEAEYLHAVDEWNEGHFEEARHSAHELIEEIEGAVGRGTLRLLFPASVVVAIYASIRFLVGLLRGDRRTDVQPAE